MRWLNTNDSLAWNSTKVCLKTFQSEVNSFFLGNDSNKDEKNLLDKKNAVRILMFEKEILYNIYIVSPNSSYFCMKWESS